MAISSTKDFWKLVCGSRLLTDQECRQLHASFKANGGAPEDFKSLADWLVKKQKLTNYQARAIISGNAGPFFFSDYKVLQHLPYGDVTRLFLALHVPAQHKVMAHFWADPESLSELDWQAACEWARRHAQIVHPNLDRCYETITRTKHKIAITENPKGNHLGAILNRDGSLPIAKACDVIRQAATGLDILHQAGLVHGRIQPNSLCRQPNGHVKLLRHPTITAKPIDFSLPDPKGRLLARSDYFAPELAGPDVPLSPATDIYALGCSLYLLLVGRPPFAGGKVDEKMVRHAREPIEPLEKLIDAPEGLTDLVSFMMAKNRHLRLKTAAEVAERLEQYSNADETTSPVPRSSESRYLRHLAEKRAEAENAGSKNTDGPSVPPNAPTMARSTDGVSDRQSTSPSIAVPIAAHKIENVQTKEVSNTLDGELGDAILAVGQPLRGQRVASRRRGSFWLTVAAVVGGCVAVGVIAFVLQQLVTSGSSSSSGSGTNEARNHGPNQLNATETLKPPKNAVSGSKNSTKTESDKRLDSTEPDIELVADDGASLWVSPTNGKPITLEYLPRDVQAIATCKVRDFSTHAEGTLVIGALGLAFGDRLNAWLARLDLKTEDVESATVGFTPEDIGPPASTWRLKLAEDVDFAKRLVGKKRQAETAGQTILLGTHQVFVAQDGVTLVVGSPSQIRHIIERRGRPPLLPRDMEFLRKSTDRERHFTALFTRNFLAVDGDKILEGELARLATAFEHRIDDGVQAVSLSMDVSQHAYLEVALALNTNVDAFAQAKTFSRRLSEIPADVSGHLGTVTIDRHWQKLAFRIPRMLDQLSRQIRTAVQPKMVVVNAALPANAAHNLILAANYITSSQAEQMVAVASGPQSASELLSQPIDFSFSQLSMENALRDLQIKLNDQFKGFVVKIEIAGGDLQAGGITRNQSVTDFSATNRTVAQVLTQLVMQANPDRTVKAATDANQKLVWVVGDGTDAKTAKIIITTRQAASEKRYNLPSAFNAN